MEPKNNRKLLILTVLITVIITGSVFWAASRFLGHGNIINHADSADQNASAKMDSNARKIVYWKAPMDPTEIYEQPGKSKMGMDLVPVYEDELVGGVDIRINPVVEQNMGLKTEKALKATVEHMIRTYGHITFDETRTGVVSQKYSGWVEKLYADYTGFPVVKGQPLYEVYSPDLLASQEEYLSAFKNFEKNKNTMNTEILASARRRLENFDIAGEEIASIGKIGMVKNALIVRSPFSGVVTHKNIIEGAFAKAGESLFTISDLSHVWVEAHIYEYEQNLVFQDQEVEMNLSYNPEKTYKGKIAYIFPYLQQKTRDVIIRIDFENTGNDLKPDMFVKIKIKTRTGKIGISIPSEAVIYSGEKKIVFIAKGNGTFAPQEIQTGIYLENGRVEILSGLSEGDDVVISGQFLLDSESKLKEAIQKMMAVKSGSSGTDSEDAFFDDMEPEDNFFEDME